MNQYDLIVIGGGASGLMAAGKAGSLGLKVLVLEKMKRPGIKLSITGKGRCNVTNSLTINEFIKKLKPNGKFFRQALHHFFNTDTIQFFEEMNVPLKLERGGRYFPQSEKAPDVVRALVRYCEKQNVTLYNNTQVAEILTTDECIRGVRYHDQQMKSEMTVTASAVLLATGGDCYHTTGTTGDGYPLAMSVGHSVTDIFGSLIPVDLDHPHQEQLAGLHLKNVKLSVWNDRKKIDEEFGEMEFNETGITGPIVLKLSRNISERIKNGESLWVEIDLKPALNDVKLDNRLLRNIEELGNQSVLKLLKGLFPQQLIPVCCDINEIESSTKCIDFGAKRRKKLKLWTKGFRLPVRGVRPMTEAIVTAGGIDLKEVNPRTMESKLVNGLYFSGEVLDVDADTGGYNLQVAFSTGILAAESIAKNRNV